MGRHRSFSSVAAFALSVLVLGSLPNVDVNRLTKWIPVGTTLPFRSNVSTSNHSMDAIAVTAQASESAKRPSSPTPPAAAEQPAPGSAQAPGPAQGPAPSPAPAPQGLNPNSLWQTAKLRVRVIDGRSQQPLQGAEVVILETEQRVTTGRDGYTQWVDAPVFRNPRLRPLVAEIHGQLGVIAYKNGYRDSIHMGIRMHEGTQSETTVWMYKIGPGDDRIEPVLYEVPYHHLWLVELADRFRSKTQPGEGPERT